jgi:predicted CoA-binding protein
MEGTFYLAFNQDYEIIPVDPGVGAAIFGRWSF